MDGGISATPCSSAESRETTIQFASNDDAAALITAAKSESLVVGGSCGSATIARAPSKSPASSAPRGPLALEIAISLRKHLHPRDRIGAARSLRGGDQLLLAREQ